MKKVLLSLLLVLVIFVCYSTYKFISYNTLSDVDREYILKNLAPDSEGRGYSDEANRRIIHDNDILTNAGFNKDLIRDFTLLRKKYNKNFIQMLLSKNKEEFLSLYRERIIISECIGWHFADFNYFEKLDIYEANGKSNSGENENIMFGFNVFKRKYFKFLSIEEKKYYLGYDFNPSQKNCESVKGLK